MRPDALVWPPQTEPGAARGVYDPAAGDAPQKRVFSLFFKQIRIIASGFLNPLGIVKAASQPLVAV